MTDTRLTVDASTNRLRPAVVMTIFAAGLVPAATGRAEGASRDLPPSVTPGKTFTVTITIEPPGGTFVVGLEDQPPSGWTVSNISDGGTFDVQSLRVKWGPFFQPSVPPWVTYDVTAPMNFPGVPCFSGTVSFDGADEPVGADQCLPALAPALKGWGLATLLLLLLACGEWVIDVRNRTLPCPSGRTASSRNRRSPSSNPSCA
jgi:hypothetical protein